MKRRLRTLVALHIIYSQRFIQAFSPSPSFCDRGAVAVTSSWPWRLHSKSEPISSSKDAIITQDGKEKGEAPTDSTTSQKSVKQPPLTGATPNKRRLELAWCNHNTCYTAIREKVVGEHNHMELTGPATGQVVYSWEQYSMESGSQAKATANEVASPPAVLMLVKRDEDELLAVAVETIEQLMSLGVQVLVDGALREELANFDCVDLESDMIRLFDPQPVAGFGSGEQLSGSAEYGSTANGSGNNGDDEGGKSTAGLSDPDLVVTLGGDGLLMYAAHLFSGPAPPMLPVAGGSMGFLTPFAREEMLEAILISLGLMKVEDRVEDALVDEDAGEEYGLLQISQRANNNMQIEATTREGYNEKPPLAFGNNNHICISMRMRLDCRIFGSDGSLRSRHAVLNEVVIDRGSSPYLASLECFCDDVHLTTVQADGIIFSTPTGSTAYSMAAGGSVVHPAVPAILVTPICPHVLSFRSMVFPDHVVLRCYVPSDARSSACVHFDGKHRTELFRGDSVQIQMSAHPVPTINRADHSADWLSSLKRNFNFNTRVRQNPL